MIKIVDVKAKEQTYTFDEILERAGLYETNTGELVFVSISIPIMVKSYALVPIAVDIYHLWRHLKYTEASKEVILKNA